MKNKVLLLVSLLAVLLFVVSCAPKMSDEELQAELSKLSPEERVAVTAEDSEAFAGMAKANPKLAKLRSAYQRSGLKSVPGNASKEVSGEMPGAAPGTGAAGNVCGDSVLVAGEQCDDGNAVSGDGCSSTCQAEVVQQSVCGDGVLAANEQCDDGNAANGDGCSSSCQTEQQNLSVQQLCAPNQWVCDSVLYKAQCKSDGSGYNAPVKCASGEMCSKGVCVATLQKPDLVANSTTFNYSLEFNATSGKNDVVYNITVKNVGPVNAGFFSTMVKPMVNGASANYFGASLAAGKELSVVGKYQGELVCPGTHTLNVTVDVYSQVAESNEENNLAWPLPAVTC